jgi:hypothetical protein
MAKKSILTGKGKDFLRGKRPGVSKRGLPKVGQETPPNIVLRTGETLNIPASAIYRALTKMHENFSAEVPLRGGRILGGALCDFVLWDRRLVIEYQGPFHDSAEGRLKDFYRRAVREQAHFMVAYLYERDLIHLHRRLTEIMVSPTLYAIYKR